MACQLQMQSTFSLLVISLLLISQTQQAWQLRLCLVCDFIEAIMSLKNGTQLPPCTDLKCHCLPVNQPQKLLNHMNTWIVWSSFWKCCLLKAWNWRKRSSHWIESSDTDWKKPIPARKHLCTGLQNTQTYVLLPIYLLCLSAHQVYSSSTHMCRKQWQLLAQPCSIQVGCHDTSLGIPLC